MYIYLFFILYTLYDLIIMYIFLFFIHYMIYHVY